MISDFERKLYDLGFSSYKSYTKSDHWKDFSRKNRATSCFCCGVGKKLQVHHITYDRLGVEIPEDVVTVCQRCHDKVHKLVNSGRAVLLNAHLKLTQIPGMDLRTRPVISRPSTDSTMNLARWKEIVAHHEADRKQGRKLHPKTIAFRKWFDEKPRTQAEVDTYWGHKHESDSQAESTLEFVEWLKEKPRLNGEVAAYWKMRKKK